MTVKVRGMQKLHSAIDRELKRAEGDNTKALSAAARFIAGEAVALAPREFGVLRNSVFRDVTPKVARVGFTAEYAGWVHEMPMKNKGKPRPLHYPSGTRRDDGSKREGLPNGTFWDKGENKFLEKAMNRNFQTIIAIIKKRLVR